MIANRTAARTSAAAHGDGAIFEQAFKNIDDIRHAASMFGHQLATVEALKESLLHDGLAGEL